MILQSLITDASYLSLDCAKTKLTKGMIVEISDDFYWEKEVQNAIKMNLIKLVGDPPAARPVPQEERPERKIKLVCNSRMIGKVAFDCIKDHVQAGQALWVPESKMNHPEIQNALDSGILIDPENTQERVSEPVHVPAALDEVRITEEESTSSNPPPRTQTTSQTRRRRRTSPTSPIRARRIARMGEGNAEENDSSGEIIGGESEIVVPTDGSFNSVRNSARREIPVELPAEETSVQDGDESIETPVVDRTAPKEPLKEPTKINSDEPFSFLDIFGDGK